MTLAISKEIHFLAGLGFYLKLTPMSNAHVPLREIYMYQGLGELY